MRRKYMEIFKLSNGVRLRKWPYKEVPTEEVMKKNQKNVDIKLMIFKPVLDGLKEADMGMIMKKLEQQYQVVLRFILMTFL